MSDENTTPDNTDAPKKTTTKEKVVAGAKTTAAVAEKVSATAEVAGNTINMIKWVAIAIVAVCIVGGGYGLLLK